MSGLVSRWALKEMEMGDFEVYEGELEIKFQY